MDCLFVRLGAVTVILASDIAWEAVVFLPVLCFIMFVTNLRVGYILGAWRGRGSEGIALALFLGPLGWLLTLFLPANPGSPTYHRSLSPW